MHEKPWFDFNLLTPNLNLRLGKMWTLVLNGGQYLPLALSK